MPDMNIFQNDAFSMLSLTEGIERLPYKPGRIGEMGLFNEEGIDTTFVMIDEVDGWLELIPIVERGGPATIAHSENRTARMLKVPHLPLEKTIQADAIQNTRAFGRSELEAVATKVNGQMQKMVGSHEVTLEFHRASIVQGLLLDADGSVYYDMFDEFGKTEIVVDFNFSTATLDVRNVCVDIARKMTDAMGGTPWSGLHAFCGANFFDSLVSHPEVKATYDRFQDSLVNRSDMRQGFPYGGIVFEEYHGGVGSQAFFSADEARFFPTGAEGLFKTYYAPGNFMETVNTMGRRFYAKQAVDAEFQRYVKIWTEQNPLCMCARPEALIKGTFS